MAEINDEMKEMADYAVKSAKDRYKKDLDFSEQSIIILDNILTKIYWGFSGRTDDGGESGLVYNTALIWGSYLGEYMIFKWGGKWILKGSDRLVSINNLEFSPIKLIYQKISDRPQLSVEDYINDTKRIIYTSVVNPQNVQHISQKTERLREQISVTPIKKSIGVDRRTIYIIGGIVGALVIIAGCIIGYSFLRSSGIPAIGAIKTSTSTNTQAPTQVLPTATLASSDTPIPTVTPLPTYTAQPTETTIPTFTPSLTYTELPSSTPTDTETPIPTNTPRPTFTRTYTPVPPPNTPVPPTVPPVVIVSCDVNPSIVEPDINQRITFIVQFSAPGYSFTAHNDSGYPGESGCDGTDNDGDSVAYCDGMSGEIKPNTRVDVQITSSVGNCSTGYNSP
jgi:regulator of extracellular matrix RemA (YlzA/DUF370 family)